MNPVGWREFPCAPQASPATLDALLELAVSLLSDNMARASGALGLRPYHRPKPLAGTALTIHTRPGDNLAIHRAFEFCRPGDVLVIDGAGDLTQALMGEIMATYAESLGVRGLVIDGAIRDVGALRQHDFPVYARGVTHRGPYKNGPGEINVPVTVGGMVVHPGDIIVGDEDGLLAIAPADVDAVIEGARRQQAKETAALESIANGTFERGWVNVQRDRMMNGS
ncbi:methyltransferase [Paraburkholderia monticola]|uniref:Putative 4-hydroxy-4-methyl-2-oxoglutarate aldolase n=1 Tax=Paraburkholderia monticola TaxID=1399968 RepID=A0A149PE69_9BURK|nr:RraA family protein [Paraburkholderia monticola]KXU83166.1 methyltransferase [Paraburkholderia monticola]